MAGWYMPGGLGCFLDVESLSHSITLSSLRKACIIVMFYLRPLVHYS